MAGIKNNYSRNNFNELIEELKEMPLWKTYFKLGEIISNLDNYDSEIIKNIYNKLFKMNYTYNQIKKELLNKWIKFKNKFEQLVPNVYFKIIDKPKFTTTTFKL